VSEDGETHQGIYDVSAFSSVPGLTILAPASAAELEIMLRYALSRQEPCLIRYPKAHVPQEKAPYQTKLTRGRGVFVHQHQEAQALILSSGGLTAKAEEAVDELARKNIMVDHYNLRFLKPLDEEYLAGLLAKYSLAFVVEDGVTQGGVGEHIRSVAMGRRVQTQIELCGFPEQIFPQMTRSELLAKAGLSASALAQRVAQAIKDKRQFALVKDDEKQAHA
jgi:1-deoxy-D-xylulose-5-phosphate synthase